MLDTLVFYPYASGGADTVVPLPARGFLLALIVSLHVAGAMALWRAAAPAEPVDSGAVLRVDWIVPAAAPAALPSPAPETRATPAPVQPAHPVRVRTETRQAAPARTPVVRAAETVQSMPVAANPAPEASEVPASADVAAPALADIDIAAAVRDVAAQVRGEEGGGGGGANDVAPDFNANYLGNPEPEYPALSIRLREEGVVRLRVFVTVDGRAGEVNLYRSSGFARLDKTAIESVARWRFRPAQRGGKPVADWVVVPVRFHLQN
ncbi:MAG: TonB family protein [Azoarcus sp.]|jgi:protein TonB|nr:TonB family protein [Azoarcus sp.]